MNDECYADVLQGATGGDSRISGGGAVAEERITQMRGYLAASPEPAGG